MKNTKNFDAERYAKEAEKLWGNTDAYKEFKDKSSGRTPDDEKRLGAQMMDIFAKLDKVKDKDVSSEEVLDIIRELKNFVSANYYDCTDRILGSLGQMYAAGGDFTANIDKYTGDGTAVFAGKAIAAYLKEKKA